MSDTSWLARRAEIVAEGNQLLETAEEWEVSGDQDPWVITARRWPDRAGEQRFARLRRDYLALLPDVAVARCPDTGVVVRWSIDTGDLDGWFWDSDHQVTREPAVPPTWRAMTGAVRIGGPVAWAPFQCRLGPGVPYVVPRVLDNDGVRAVVRQIPIGPHTGWAVSYFGPRLSGVAGIGRWGGSWAPTLDGDGIEHSYCPDEDNEFDLDPYFASGKLLWISPDDDSATLREGVAGNPYRGLEGPRECGYVEDGESRYGAVDFEESGYPGVYVEFDGTGITPPLLERLRSLLALDPVDDKPRWENAPLGRRRTGAEVPEDSDLPPDTRLLLMRGTPWRLETDCHGEFPTDSTLDRVRRHLLDTLTRLDLEPSLVLQYRVDGVPRRFT